MALFRGTAARERKADWRIERKTKSKDVEKSQVFMNVDFTHGILQVNSHGMVLSPHGYHYNLTQSFYRPSRHGGLI